MPDYEAEREFARGVAELERGTTLAAMVHFERAVDQLPLPLYRSYLAYCLAKERGQVQKGLEICRQAVADEPAIVDIHLNLGRIYLLTGNKPEALRALREGMAIESHPAIIEIFTQLGIRKQPPIKFLSRDNPINKYLGKLFSRLGLR
jgi:tetratricopeptide (TPR) repeat protein